MMKRGVATYKGDQWLAIESANQQIKSLERSLAAVEKEINSEKKVSAHQASRSHAEYMNTAQLVRQELGNDISDSRLDLEIYLRADSKSEIISESAVYNQLREDNPRLAKHYLKAIAHVALTYKSLSDRKTPDLDRWAKRMVNVYLAKFHVQENNLSQNLQPKITKGKGLTM